MATARFAFSFSFFMDFRLDVYSMHSELKLLDSLLNIGFETDLLPMYDIYRTDAVLVFFFSIQ